MVHLAKKVLKETVEVKGLILVFLYHLFDSALNKLGIKDPFSPCGRRCDCRLAHL